MRLYKDRLSYRQFYGYGKSNNVIIRPINSDKYTMIAHVIASPKKATVVHATSYGNKSSNNNVSIQTHKHEATKMEKGPTKTERFVEFIKEDFAEVCFMIFMGTLLLMIAAFSVFLTYYAVTHDTKEICSTDHSTLSEKMKEGEWEVDETKTTFDPATEKFTICIDKEVEEDDE